MPAAADGHVATGATAATPSLSTAHRFEEVRRTFLGLEAEHVLFDHTVGGCRFWDYMRVEVFDNLVTQLGLLGQKHAVPDRTLRGFLKETRSITTSLVRRNPYLAEPAELLFLGHPRRRLEADGTYWDAYSDPLLEGLGRSALVIERPFFNRHFQPARSQRIAHLDAMALVSTGLRQLQGDPLSAANDASLADLEHTLAVEFGAHVPIRTMTRAKLRLRRSQLPCWRALLRRVKPRAMFLVVSYGNEIPIEACRSLGIPTIELQHGVISPQNLGYHFPLPECQKQLFPDWLFTFGDFWRTAARFPIPDERVVSIGYPYLEMQRATAVAAANSNDRRRVVFVSMRSIGAKLSRLAIEVANSPRLRGAEVVYKLHPGERQTWRTDYPWLLNAPLRVADGHTPHLYELFAQSTLQVGVYSTAMFEGLAFGLDTAIVRLPGYDAMQRMVEHADGARWADNSNDILNALEHANGRRGAVDVEPFFRSNAVENARRALARIP